MKSLPRIHQGVARTVLPYHNLPPVTRRSVVRYLKVNLP